MPSSGIWTNNWSALKNAQISGIFRSGWATLRNRQGNLLTQWYNNGQYPPKGLMTGSWGIGADGSTGYTVWFGSSNLAVSADQIDLGSEIASSSNGLNSITTNTGEISYNDTTKVASRVITFTVQWRGSSPVTIREWGIFCQSPGVLIYRAVLDEPVTLAQYESATLTVTLSVEITNPI